MVGYMIDTTSDFVSNRLTFATKHVSDKAEEFVEETDRTLQNAFNEASLWAQDKLVDMAETLSLPRNLLASMEEEDDDDLVKSRFDKYGRPDANVKYYDASNPQFAM